MPDDPTRAKLSALFRGYKERKEGEAAAAARRAEDARLWESHCRDRLRTVVLPELLSLVTDIRAEGHIAEALDRLVGQGHPTVQLAFTPLDPGPHAVFDPSTLDFHCGSDRRIHVTRKVRGRAKPDVKEAPISRPVETADATWVHSIVVAFIEEVLRTQ